MELANAELADLEIDDEGSFRHVELYSELKRVLGAVRHRFAVPSARDRSLSWDRAVFLNLTFYDPLRPVDVLADRQIPADVVAHVAWHVAAQRALGEGGAHESLLAESVASAFDIYLVGRLLGHAPDSSFLESQVPAMREAAESAGLTEDDLERLLETVSRDPETAFEDLRCLLFEISVRLLRCQGPVEAQREVETFADHRFYPLLHHYELSNWILAARAKLAESPKGPDGSSAGARLHAELRDRGSGSLDFLVATWIHPILAGT